MALTMIAQPSGGSDSCQIACSRPQLKGATPSLGVPVVAWVARPIASISSFGQRTRKSTVGRLVASKTVTPRIEILSFEHPAFSNQNVMGGDRNELLHGASAPTLTDSLNSDAARVKATIGVDRLVLRNLPSNRPRTHGMRDKRLPMSTPSFRPNLPMCRSKKQRLGRSRLFHVHLTGTALNLEAMGSRPLLKSGKSKTISRRLCPSQWWDNRWSFYQSE
jgi:hypothetical protein